MVTYELSILHDFASRKTYCANCEYVTADVFISTINLSRLCTYCLNPDSYQFFTSLGAANG